ncbi:MAG: ABC transporter permease [Sulfuriferula sp.]|nr:ABC transporter permease [Sulfuriferula sp.]
MLRLALRLLLRDSRAGGLRVLVLAVMLSVAGLAAVHGFAERMQAALSLESNRLLGADLVLVSDHAIDTVVMTTAQAQGLLTAQTMQFPSMISTDHDNQLADIKAVSAGYPLRGQLRIAPSLSQADKAVADIPQVGTVWLAPRLANALNVRVGDSVAVGYRQLRVVALLIDEPDRGGDFFNLAPRLLMNQADIAATGLVTTGSRVTYRLLLAGASQPLASYQAVLAQHLTRGQRLMTAADARPELRDVLEKGERYLGLSVLLAVLLAAVAILLAARHFLHRHLDTCALLRCFGASQATIVKLYLWQLAILGMFAALAGALLGYAGQAVLAEILGKLANLSLPSVGVLPFLQAMLAGWVLLAGFSLPTLLMLRHTPAIHILRKDVIALDKLGVFAYMAGLAALVALLFWQVQDVKLTGVVLLGLAVVLVVTVAFAGLLVLAAGWLAARSAGSWRYGLLNLRRRAAGSVIQISAFTLGLLAVLVLTIVRGDLLDSWHATIPAQAPNRFVINIQADQVVPVRAFLQQHHIAQAQLYPMIRGRLTAINGREVYSANYADQQTQRLLDREFNLSYTQTLPAEAQFSAGQSWRVDDKRKQFSVEQGIADKLHLQLGDTLQFDIAGTPVIAKITSLRKVNWDSFKVNFFVIANAPVLQAIPASYITSFYLPPTASSLLNEIVRGYPNLTVIDVSAIMQTVQAVLNRVTTAVQFVFVFSLVAGLLVLYAALAATRDERALETALWRVLGATKRQLWQVQIIEFMTIGLLAGALAAMGATAIAWGLSSYVFKVPYHIDGWLWVSALCAGGMGVTVAGVLGLWRISRVPPLVTLRGN